jgi:SAM-dependent methyltransferase
MDLRGLAWNWEQFARTDPLWAIVTFPEKRGGRWTPEEFFATGRTEVDALFAHLDALGVASRHGTAVDFGCGVGRLTQALATRYETVVGIDISPTMVELAERYNRVGARCRYVVNTRDDLGCLASGSVDLVYSHIVLQHMEPRYALAYVREFVRLLAPDGVAVFQMPYEGPSTVVARAPLAPLVGRVLSRLRAGRPAAAVSEMYVVPKQTVLDAVAASGGRVVDVRDDGAAGPGHRSCRYCVMRADACAG